MKKDFAPHESTQELGLDNILEKLNDESIDFWERIGMLSDAFREYPSLFRSRNDFMEWFIKHRNDIDYWSKHYREAWNKRRKE